MSAWGGSWGVSWLASWDAAQAAPPTQPDGDGYGPARHIRRLVPKATPEALREAEQYLRGIPEKRTRREAVRAAEKAEALLELLPQTPALVDLESIVGTIPAQIRADREASRTAELIAHALAIMERMREADRLRDEDDAIMSLMLMHG